MSCFHQSRTRPAFALSVVIWIVAALLTGVAYIVHISKDEIRITEKLDAKLRTRLRAESILEMLKYYVMTANYDSNSLYNHVIYDNIQLPSRIVVDGRPYRLNDGTTFSIQDVSALIDVFDPSYDLIAQLASKPTDRTRYYTIHDSIKDWIDKDDIVSLNGAEWAFYHFKKGVDYGPRNSPAIQSVDELHLINGVDSLPLDRWKILKTHLYYGPGSYYNLALVDDLLLAKLLHLNMLEAEALSRLRRESMKKFMQRVKSMKTYNDEAMGFSLSFEMIIKIKVQRQGVISRLKTTILFKQGETKGILIENFSID